MKRARKPTKKPARPPYYKVPAVVYYLYGRYEGQDDVLLYIGVTRDVRDRFAIHKSTKDWWPDVQRHEERWFEHRGDADRFEDDELRTHRPPRNPKIPGQPSVGGKASPYRVRSATLHDDVWTPTLKLAAARRVPVGQVVQTALMEYLGLDLGHEQEAAAT